MTIEGLIRSVKSLAHEEIDQDLDSAAVVASINRGIRMLDDLHSRTGTVMLHRFTVAEEVRQPVSAGALDLEVFGATALTLSHDNAVLGFRWSADGEEKQLVRKLDGDTVLLQDLLGTVPDSLHITVEGGIVWQLLALSCPAYTSADMIPRIVPNRLVYSIKAYASDFLSFVNAPPVTAYGCDVRGYIFEGSELTIPETQNADIVVEYRKTPREITIEDYEDQADTVELDVAEDVVMLLPYLVTHDLFLDDNPDVALRSYNLWEVERARYITERSNRRTLFRRNTYKGW